MTTSKSPIEKIRDEAGRIVTKLKGGAVPSGPESITFAIVQDDKVIQITWTWKFIHATSAKVLIETIVGAMTS